MGFQQQTTGFGSAVAVMCAALCFGNLGLTDEPSFTERAGMTVEWVPLSPIELFPDSGPVPGMVNQGFFASCYFLAAVNSLAFRKPETLEAMIRENRDGTYTVRFYDLTCPPGGDSSLCSFEGKSLIEVSESCLKIHHDGITEAISAGVTDLDFDGRSEVGVNLIEKAFALWHDERIAAGKRLFGPDGTLGYDGIEFGFADYACAAITGSRPGFHRLEDIPDQGTLRRLLDSSSCVMIASKPDSLPDGFVEQHAYAVLGLARLNGEYWAVIRNPWGQSEPRSPLEDSDDGLFLLALDDLHLYFETICVTDDPLSIGTFEARSFEEIEEFFDPRATETRSCVGAFEVERQEDFAGVPDGDVDGMLARSGVDFGDRFTGQLLASINGIESLLGAPTSPLSLVAGPDGENLFRSTIRGGVPQLSGKSSTQPFLGTTAVLFVHDQSKFTVELNHLVFNDILIDLYDRDGGPIDRIVVPFGTQSVARLEYSRQGGVADIAGFTVRIGKDNPETSLNAQSISFVRFDNRPVSCRPRAVFVRGDSNGDGAVDISDAIATLGVLFLGRGEIACQDAGDANDDGDVDISDAIATLGVLFLGQGTIPLPGVHACGLDPTLDDLTCESLEGCQEP